LREDLITVSSVRVIFSANALRMQFGAWHLLMFRPLASLFVP